MEAAMIELAGCSLLLVLAYVLVKAAGLLLVRPILRKKRKKS